MKNELKKQIKKLKEAKTIILNTFDIIISDEEEQLYYDQIKSLNKLINYLVNELEQYEKQQLKNI